MNTFFLHCSIALGMLAASATGMHAEGAPKPNIVLIVTDDQGWWDLASSGNPHIDTPHLDRLAGDGVRFDRFYVQPVCAPTRAGLMTGRYYLRTGLYNTRFGGDSMAKSETTVAELLKKGGYRTGLFGKWHLGQYHGYQPNQRGFDEFLGHYHGHVEHYEFATQLVHNGAPVATKGYVTDLFTDAAIEFVAASSRKKAPFFCYLAFNTPHSPHLLDTSHEHQPAGDAMIAKYLKRNLPLREARIYAQVERIDQNVGRFMQALGDSGLAENTVVAFMSDNGGVSRHWQGGLRGFKASTYEGGVRSPLFVRWPGHFPAGGRVAAQTSHVDLMPTFCELAGVPLPADRKIDGRSLLPLLVEGKGEMHHEYVYHTWNRYFPDPDVRWGISDARHKLLANFASKEKAKPAGWMLFDLAEDPGETNNIASDNPEKVRALRAEFERWYGEVTRGVRYEPIAVPVGSAEENPVELQASWAMIHGSGTRYVFSAYDWDTIEGWSRAGDAAVWKIEVAREGRYAVEVAYSCASADAGGRLRLSAGGREITFTPAATPAPGVFSRAVVGELTLPAGITQLRAEVGECPGAELMHLNRIWLRKLE